MAAIEDTSSCWVQVLDFLLVMDIVLQFFRAYVNKKSVLVVQLARIRRNYLGTWLHCLYPESAQGCPLSIALSCPLSMTTMGSLACASWPRGTMPTASHALCADLDLIQHIHCMLLLHAARIDMRSYDSSLLVCQVTKHITLMWSTHKTSQHHLTPF